MHVGQSYNTTLSGCVIIYGTLACDHMHRLLQCSMQMYVHDAALPRSMLSGQTSNADCSHCKQAA